VLQLAQKEEEQEQIWPVIGTNQNRNNPEKLKTRIVCRTLQNSAYIINLEIYANKIMKHEILYASGKI
jgi:hypothetical protein